MKYTMKYDNVTFRQDHANDFVTVQTEKKMSGAQWAEEFSKYSFVDTFTNTTSGTNYNPAPYYQPTYAPPQQDPYPYTYAPAVTFDPTPQIEELAKKVAALEASLDEALTILRLLAAEAGL